MTALSAIIAHDGAIEPARACGRMLAAQQAYAPTEALSWTDLGFALGRRLHSLLPEDRFDKGPVLSRDRRSVLIADIRLDDRDGLREVLGLASQDVAQLSDAALAMSAFERWGEGALERLVGDFALIFWNSDSRRLLLARDPLGQRPLHFHRGRNFFAAASMPKGLHALTQVPLAPDYRRLSELLLLYSENGTKTYYAEVERVPPGHKLIVHSKTVTLEPFWKPVFASVRHPKAGDYAEALREQMDQAVKSRLRRLTPPLGAQLSGGLDSSAVTATAARLLKDRNQRVTAFTSVPGETFSGQAGRGRIADEGPLAGLVAAMHPNIDHVLVRAMHDSPLARLGQYIALLDRPPQNPDNSVWIQAINDAARERGIQVLLGGMRGNATISYNGAHLLPELLGRGAWLQCAREFKAMVRAGRSTGGAALQAFGPFLPHAAWRLARRLTRQDAQPHEYSFISPAAAEALRQDQRTRSELISFASRPARTAIGARLRLLSQADPGSYNKAALAGWGIDLRDPTADRRLVEFCLSVPTREYVRCGVPRALARTTFSDRLPPALLAERRLGYQGADWYIGLDAARQELETEIDRIAASPALADFLDVGRMRDAVTHWPAGDWTRSNLERRYRFALLRAIAVARFVIRGTRDHS
jgi:asparagine synthase (glutamine-hydrolysing)